MDISKHAPGTISTWPADYTIRVRGLVDPGWSEWLGYMQVKHTNTGDSLLTGRVLDPSALHSLLNRIFDMNLLLLFVQRMDDH